MSENNCATHGFLLDKYQCLGDCASGAQIQSLLSHSNEPEHQTEPRERSFDLWHFFFCLRNEQNAAKLRTQWQLRSILLLHF